MGEGRSKRIRKAIERMHALDESARAEVFAALGRSENRHAEEEHARPDDRLVDALARAGVEPRVLPAPPDFTIGDVQPLRRRAEGGLATVYAARQIAAVDTGADRLLTLLLMRPPASPPALERFRLVVRAFAGLRHSALPRVIDVGTTPEGPAWASFERWPERPFAAVADELELSLDGRLRAFLTVCEGVETARLEGWHFGGLRADDVVADPPAVARSAVQPVIAAIDRVGPARAIDRARYAHLAPPTDPHWIAATPQADVAGLAGLLHALVIGRPPGPMGADELPPVTDGASAETAITPRPEPIAASERLSFMFRPVARAIARRRRTSVLRLRWRLVRGLDEVIRRGLIAGDAAARPADAFPHAGALADAVRRHVRG